MKMDIFKLRHAALVAALALAVGAPASFADEVPVTDGSDLLATTPPPTDGMGPSVTDDFTIDPPALPVEGGEVVPDDGAPVEGNEVVVDEAPVVDETPVDVVPLDDCGVICQNVAGEPEPAVYKNDDVPPEVLQFGANGEAPDPAQNISAELSGAIGAAEQSAAAAVAVSDGALVDPLSATAPTAILAKAAGADGVNVIRDGHLR